MNTPPRSIWARGVQFFVENKLVAFLLTLLLIGAGLWAAPFDWAPGWLERDPVPVDAIPDIGENQQIVFTRWAGRSPRDVEDQVTYPLTTALLGLPGVKTVRSNSMLGFSSIYVIFEDGVDFYWSRSRILEKLNALPSGTLPEGVAPTLGPDATALGQIFWYTLEGRDPETGELVGGWDLHELRTIQDWTVRHSLQAASGVSEVASIGGHVQEYQVNVDPERLLAHDISLGEVARAVRQANLDVGARTIEINRVEYVIRGVGQLEGLEDLEQTVITTRQDRPIRILDVARVGLGPANRRGALDMAGAEAVGGVVVARYGANPSQVIARVRARIEEIQPGLPRRTLEDGRVSQVTIVPFYDRSKLVAETLDTLSDALVQQILITILVVLLLLGHLRSSAIISAMLPLAVLMSFVLMKLMGVSANIMSLSGIAIAIGTMVDMGIVLTENMVSALEEAEPGEDRVALVSRAAGEVAPAVFTSGLTTILSFLPVFALQAAEGKLFRPLAYTKTFALGAALLLSLTLLPALVHLIVWERVEPAARRGSPLATALRAITRPTHWRDWALAAVGVGLIVFGAPWWALACGGLALSRMSRGLLPERWRALPIWIENLAAAGLTAWLLTEAWMPLGYGRTFSANLAAVAIAVLGIGAIFWAFLQVYDRLLAWTLRHKALFLSAPLALVILGASVWLGFDSVFGWLPQRVRMQPAVVEAAHALPGLGREFMPPFDEGSFLYMPTTMPHASFGEALEQLKVMDASIKQQVPEVEEVVGKLGRVESALDPAPVSMFETIITYKPEWRIREDGTRERQWRDHIRSPDDIWSEIQRAAERPGLTSAPKLMPINTRIVMLQSGMRAPMGVKIKGPDLETIEEVGRQIEELLKQVPAVRPETVFAERVVGKPYLEIELDREAIGRHGLDVAQVQRVIQIGLGGVPLTRTVEGRARHGVRVRYAREERDSPEALGRLLIPAPGGRQIPLEQLAHIEYVRGPQMIKSEDTFLTSYVIFDRDPEVAEADAVEQAQAFLASSLATGELELPAGVSYSFDGAYKNQLRGEARLRVLVPLALVLIFIVLYLQFRRASSALIIYSGVIVAASGGMILLWLFGQPWFLDVTVVGIDLRELLGVEPMNLSVAVWVGFIALIGIATDDGVVMATYLHQRFFGEGVAPPEDVAQIRQRVLAAGQRRVRPCLMTTATTILALLPVVTSTGRGADVMAPMAIPSLGGMAIELLTLFVVPVLYSTREELRLHLRRARGDDRSPDTRDTQP